MWANTPPFGAFGLTYSNCLKSGGYLRSPKADIPWRSVSWPASTFCARDDTRAAAPRRSASRRVCSRALVIEAFAFCQFLCRACRLVALPRTRDLLLFAKHLFCAALAANCLLPGEKSDFCHTSRQFELAYGRRLRCLLNAHSGVGPDAPEPDLPLIAWRGFLPAHGSREAR